MHYKTIKMQVFLECVWWGSWRSSGLEGWTHSTYINCISRTCSGWATGGGSGQRERVCADWIYSLRGNLKCLFFLCVLIGGRSCLCWLYTSRVCWSTSEKEPSVLFWYLVCMRKNPTWSTLLHNLISTAISLTHGVQIHLNNMTECVCVCLEVSHVSTAQQNFALHHVTCVWISHHLREEAFVMLTPAGSEVAANAVLDGVTLKLLQYYIKVI